VHLLANHDWQHTAGVRQGIQFMLADLATNVQAARLMTWWSAKVTETGRPFLYESSMAKNFASDSHFAVWIDPSAGFWVG
jgi:alkylation response protein AidB-like acyl-CoA dehydrogenase